MIHTHDHIGWRNETRGPLTRQQYIEHNDKSLPAMMKSCARVVTCNHMVHIDDKLYSLVLMVSSNDASLDPIEHD